MIIELYDNISDTNMVDKTIVNIATIDGTLRDRCSVTDPVIVINIESVSGVNYFYIPEFGRYYYVNNITSVRNGLWFLSGHVDVLMSYREQFRNLSAIIARTEDSRYTNLYLEDDKLIVTCRRDFSLIPFPNRVSVGGKQFVLTVAGGPSSS